jgi:putative ABC transport system ATP-binding protein
VTDVSKTYRRGEIDIPVLRDINLDVADADFVSLMGPSGSGKTTLLNIIGGIDTPTSGRVVMAGVDIAALDDGSLAAWRTANVGFVFPGECRTPAPAG